MKILGIVNSIGTMTDNKTGKQIDWNNYLLQVAYEDPNEVLKSCESLVCGTIVSNIKVKAVDFNKCCQCDPKNLLGKSVDLFYDNDGRLRVISEKK